ncbi:MAG: hypothetical protein HS126_22060 [Anaerolineales bacterium]|nr:hypothetical protein [Anaerolineales bacterium]
MVEYWPGHVWNQEQAETAGPPSANTLGRHRPHSGLVTKMESEVAKQLGVREDQPPSTGPSWARWSRWPPRTRA